MDKLRVRKLSDRRNYNIIRKRIHELVAKYMEQTKPEDETPEELEIRKRQVRIYVEDEYL